jgi:SAM-dependent methyltransferase
MKAAGAQPLSPPPLAFSPTEKPELVAALMPRLIGDAAPLPLEIHRDDHMFRFLLEHHKGFRELALVDYFRSGRSVARLLRQILEWRFAERRQAIRLLDFASGFGRSTRFYLDDLPASRIWVSDLFPEAVDFQQRAFGVQGFVSASQAEELRCDLRFDAVMVASLFSHLPREAFLAWLRRLIELVAPGGLLMVSVDDEELLPPDRVMEDGFCYQAGAEIPELDPRGYGVAWVSRRFMAEALASATRGRGAWWRLPRALWSYQDLYVVSPDGFRPTAPLEAGAEVVGALYDCHLGVDGRTLEVCGWAASPDGSRVERVEVSVEGLCEAACAPSTASEGVDRLLGRPPGQPVDWGCTLTSNQPFPSEALLAVEAVSQEGDRFLVHLAPLSGTQLYLRCLQEAARARRIEETLQDERLSKDGVIHQLETRLAAMEASRFWQLRNLWWRARRALGLGKDLPGRPATRR